MMIMKKMMCKMAMMMMMMKMKMMITIFKKRERSEQEKPRVVSQERVTKKTMKADEKQRITLNHKHAPEWTDKRDKSVLHIMRVVPVV